MSGELTEMSRRISRHGVSGEFEVMEGVVAWFKQPSGEIDKNEFGFIEDADRVRYFFHFNDGGVLRPGQSVPEFRVQIGAELPRPMPTAKVLFIPGHAPKGPKAKYWCYAHHYDQIQMQMDLNAGKKFFARMVGLLVRILWVDELGYDVLRLTSLSPRGWAYEVESIRIHTEVHSQHISDLRPDLAQIDLRQMQDNLSPETVDFLLHTDILKIVSSKRLRAAGEQINRSGFTLGDAIQWLATHEDDIEYFNDPDPEFWVGQTRQTECAVCHNQHNASWTGREWLMNEHSFFGGHCPGSGLPPFYID